MREQHDPMRLVVQLATIAALLATVALSIGCLRDVATAREHALVARAPASFDGHERPRGRTITTDQLPLDEACPRIWADSRRRLPRLEQEVGKALITSPPTSPSQQSSDTTRAESNRPTDAPRQQE
jgi:hypothetical protein